MNQQEPGVTVASESTAKGVNLFDKHWTLLKKHEMGTEPGFF